MPGAKDIFKGKGLKGAFKSVKRAAQVVKVGIDVKNDFVKTYERAEISG